MRVKLTAGMEFVREATRVGLRAITSIKSRRNMLAVIPNGVEDYAKIYVEHDQRASAVWVHSEVGHIGVGRETELDTDRSTWLSVDALLATGSKVHAEWQIKRGDSGFWQEGKGRIDLWDDCPYRRSHEVTVRLVDKRIKVVELWRLRQPGGGETGSAIGSYIHTTQII